MREAAFVRAYLTGETRGRAQASAGAAGYATTNGAIGWRLLHRPHIRAEIVRLLAKQDITADRVLAELRHVAYSDMREYVEWGPDGVKLKASAEMSDLAAAAVAEVSETTTKDGGSLKFKLHDKMAALNTLAKHLRIVGDEDAGGSKEIHFHFNTNVDFDKLLGAQPA